MEAGGSVTMLDVLEQQEAFEEDAHAVLGASDDKECTYGQGYVRRQALYACLTCCPDRRAGLCLACSLACHENHELVELYTKRNFRCDCGGPAFPNKPCTFNGSRSEPNALNKYNQNFSGLYCKCSRPYPDPEAPDDDEMIQCIVCEDWLHSRHLNAEVPAHDRYSEMICEDCMQSNDFLNDYLQYKVTGDNVEDESMMDSSGICDQTKTDLDLTADVDVLNCTENSIMKIDESKPKEDLEKSNEIPAGEDKVVSVNESKTEDTPLVADANLSEMKPVTEAISNGSDLKCDTISENNEILNENASPAKVCEKDSVLDANTITEKIETREENALIESVTASEDKLPSSESKVIESEDKLILDNNITDDNLTNKNEEAFNTASENVELKDVTSEELMTTEKGIDSINTLANSTENIITENQNIEESNKNLDDYKDNFDSLPIEKMETDITCELENNSDNVANDALEKDVDNVAAESLNLNTNLGTEHVKVQELNTEEKVCTDEGSVAAEIVEKPEDQNSDNCRNLESQETNCDTNEKLSTLIDNMENLAEPTPNCDELKSNEMSLHTDTVCEENSSSNTDKDMATSDEAQPPNEPEISSDKSDCITENIPTENAESLVNDTNVSDTKATMNCEELEEILSPKGESLNDADKEKKEEMCEDVPKLDCAEIPDSKSLEKMDVDTNEPIENTCNNAGEPDQSVDNVTSSDAIENATSTEITNDNPISPDITKENTSHTDIVKDNTLSTDTINDAVNMDVDCDEKLNKESLSENNSESDPSIAENYLKPFNELIKVENVKSIQSEIEAFESSEDKKDVALNAAMDEQCDSEKTVMSLNTTNDKDNLSTVDKKRKLASESSTENEVEISEAKRCKPNRDIISCIKPVNNPPLHHKGAVFWPNDWRAKLCSCFTCSKLYKDKNVSFLLDNDDTVIAYENLGKMKTSSSSSQYEKGLEALSSLGRVQQINAITEYNKMKEKLVEFLRTFKDKREVVREEDIKDFFAGMKPKREPDGVYFCR